MIIDPCEVLRAAFKNALDRKVKPELLQDFIDRSRRYHAGDAGVLAVVD